MNRLAVIATTALVLSAGSASAQVVIELTPEQETTIYSTLSRGTVGVAPSDVQVIVGAEIPREIELREVPTAVEVPVVRRYRYTVMGGRVVLVDPGTRRVVRIIER